MFFQKYLLFSAIERTSANKTRHFIHQFHEERYETKKNIHGLFMLLMTSDEEMKTTSEEITTLMCARGCLTYYYFYHHHQHRYVQFL